MTYRSGRLRTLARTLVPLAAETFRATLFPTQRARRGLEPSFEDATDITASDAVTAAANVEPGTVLDASAQTVIGTAARWNRASATRFTYATRDATGRPLPATAVHISPMTTSVPTVATVAFAPSTQGVATHCNPSLSCAVGFRVFRHPLDAVFAYEQPVINYLLALGCEIVMIDYPRDPVFNLQLYCDHDSAARALADAVRAARSLGLDADLPLGLWGFSQGGGAVARALEDPDYAADVQPRAAVVGAPPADLLEVLRHADGALAVGVVAYAAAGLYAASPEIRSDILTILSTEGIEELFGSLNMCTVGTIVQSGWRHTRRWTASGRPLWDELRRSPAILTELAARRLGTAGAPSIPYRLWASKNDDLIPAGSVVTLADAWRTPSADFEMRRFPRLPGRTGINHFGPYFHHAARDAEWLVDSLRR